jgi:hypothetical protein
VQKVQRQINKQRYGAENKSNIDIVPKPPKGSSREMKKENTQDQFQYKGDRSYGKGKFIVQNSPSK